MLCAKDPTQTHCFTAPDVIFCHVRPCWNIHQVRGMLIKEAADFSCEINILGKFHARAFSVCQQLKLHLMLL